MGEGVGGGGDLTGLLHGQGCGPFGDGAGFAQVQLTPLQGSRGVGQALEELDRFVDLVGGGDG